MAEDRDQVSDERARLVRAERRARERAVSAIEQLLRLQSLTALLSEAVSPQDVAAVVASEVRSAVGAGRAVLAVPREGERLVLLGHAALPDETGKARVECPVDDHLPIADAYRRRTAVWLPNPASWHEAYPALQDGESAAILCLPLRIGDRCLGAIGFGFPEAPPETGGPRALLEDFARHAAIALDRARLYEQTQRQRDRLQLLSDATARFARAEPNLQGVLDAVVTEVTVRMADACALMLTEPGDDTIRLAAVRHRTRAREQRVRELFEQQPLRVGEGLVGKVIGSGESVLIPVMSPEAYRDGPEAYRRHLASVPVRSVVIVPLRSAGRVFGALAASLDAEPAFTDEDRYVLQELADRAALAIDNARLFETAQRARTRAEEANRAKDQFLAMLGHELRNPLAPIVSALRLMELRGDDEFARERAILHRQVGNLQRLVDDLLDVSSVTRSQLELRRAPVELACVLDAAIELTGPLLEERGNRLETRVAATGLTVDGDLQRLTQAVANLLTNAAKHTPRGGHIEVVAERDSDSEELALHVRDGGPGIDPALLPRVFDPFVQAEQAPDRAVGGLGLGLTIVRAIVERHGGTITARNRERGAELTIRLPASTAVAEPAAAPEPAAVARPHTARILVVDDNRDAADMLADALGAIGYETRSAYDGPSALQIARELQPQVALLDIGLPEMNGYELGRRLVEQRRDAPPMLVAVTGYGQPADRIRSRTAGFVRHAVKPVDLDDIRQLLDELLMPAVQTEA